MVVMSCLSCLSFLGRRFPCLDVLCRIRCYTIWWCVGVCVVGCDYSLLCHGLLAADKSRKPRIC
jgi:hypothetical protein